MRQAGRYLPEYRELRASAGSFLDLCYNPELAARVTLQPIERFGFDAAILFSDILVVPDALGQDVKFVENEGPVLDPITDREGIAKLGRDNFMTHLEPVLETVRQVRSSLDSSVALIGFCGAPWTVATYMVGGRGSPDQAAARSFAYRDRDGFAVLMDLLVEVSVDYLCAQIDAGAQVVQLFDSWAGNLPEDEFAKWSAEPARKIVEGVRRRAPGIPIIGFPRAAGTLYRSFVDQTGVDGVSCDTSLPLAYIRDDLQPHATVQGNLDPLLLVSGGEALDRRVDEILDVLSGGPFIFNLGHGIVPQTPPEHVAQLMKRIRQ
ncbi:MAG: uroporphyrinogen decarboxylase [Hyphomicrobiaceae bacterium]|nr:uroporphyrinogen decarboxylase [Hyphomicrobiaceae bacterium]